MNNDFQQNDCVRIADENSPFHNQIGKIIDVSVFSLKAKVEFSEGKYECFLKSKMVRQQVCVQELSLSKADYYTLIDHSLDMRDKQWFLSLTKRLFKEFPNE